MKPMVKCLMLFLSTLAPLSTFAQQQAPGWMVDGMYGSGKINTVILVVAAVLIGLAVWMFTLDRRLNRLQKRN